MPLVRDTAIKEIMRRIYGITTNAGYTFSMKRVIRNPKTEPHVEDMPCTNIFESDDFTIKKSQRGATKMPAYGRRFEVWLESWIEATSEGKSSEEIIYFLQALRSALFRDGITLGGLVIEFNEMQTSRIYRPEIGDHVIGIGTLYDVVFVEDFSKSLIP